MSAIVKIPRVVEDSLDQFTGLFVNGPQRRHFAEVRQRKASLYGVFGPTCVRPEPLIMYVGDAERKLPRIVGLCYYLPWGVSWLVHVPQETDINGCLGIGDQRECTGRIVARDASKRGNFMLFCSEQFGMDWKEEPYLYQLVASLENLVS